jgi:competence protein ComEA
MSPNIPEATPKAAPLTPASPPVPKRITNAQTVCNERNEKGKACWGHLKQLRTAGERAEVHLRGDDVLYKCHRCGTLYMGPPLGHVRDPEKQRRFVEAELSAVLQAAGGTLPVIKKNDKGVYVLVEAEGAQGHAAPAAKPAAPAAAAPAAPARPATASAPPAVIAEKSTAVPAGPKPAAQPNRELNRRTTYAGVVDTGPVAGETREQKIERLQKVVAGAKQRSEEGGAEPAAVTTASDSSPVDRAAADAPITAAPAVAKPESSKAAPATTTPAPSHATGEQPDRTLMKRSTYAGVADTGPVAGETREQKIERLTKLAAAAKQKAEEGG